MEGSAARNCSSEVKRGCRCTHSALIVDPLALDANCRQCFAVHKYPILVLPSFSTQQNPSGLLAEGNPNTAKDCSDTWTTGHPKVTQGPCATCL